MVLRQFLNVGGPGRKRIVKELNRATLIPAVVQSFTSSRKIGGGHTFRLETGRSEMVRQDTVKISGRFKPDPHRQVVTGEIDG
jgi:hypothetical protein